MYACALKINLNIVTTVCSYVLHCSIIVLFDAIYIYICDWRFSLAVRSNVSDRVVCVWWARSVRCYVHIKAECVLYTENSSSITDCVQKNVLQSAKTPFVYKHETRSYTFKLFSSFFYCYYRFVFVSSLALVVLSLWPSVCVLWMFICRPIIHISFVHQPTNQPANQPFESSSARLPSERFFLFLSPSFHLCLSFILFSILRFSFRFHELAHSNRSKTISS